MATKVVTNEAVGVREFGLRSQRKKAASLGGARYEAAFKSARATGDDALASYVG